MKQNFCNLLLLISALFIGSIKTVAAMPEMGVSPDGDFYISKEESMLCDIGYKDAKDENARGDCMKKIIEIYQNKENGGQEQARQIYKRMFHEMNKAYLLEATRIKKSIANIDLEIDKAQYLLEKDATEMDVEIAMKKPTISIQSNREKQEALNRMDTLVMQNINDAVRIYSAQALLNIYDDFGVYELTPSSPKLEVKDKEK